MKKIINRILSNKVNLVLLDQAIYSGCGFLITLLLIRLLSPLQFGIYASLIIVIYFVVSISSAVVIQPLQVKLSQIKNQKEYTSFAFYLLLLIVLILSILTYIIFSMQISILKNIATDSKIIIAFASAFVVHDFFRKLFLAENKILKALLIDIFSNIFPLVIFLLVHINFEIGLSQVLTIYAACYIPGIAIAIYITRPTITLNSEWKKYFQSHLKQGKWLLLTAILQWWSNNLFVIVSGLYLGAAALGAFRFVQSLFGVLNLILQTLENYALPFASRLFQTSAESSKIYLKNMTIKGCVAIGILLTTIFLLSDQIIILAAGDSYSEYSFLIKGMSILYFVIFLAYPTRIAIRMMSLDHLFFGGYLISFTFSIISFQYLLMQFGLWGALIGLIVNQIILFTFWQYSLHKIKFELWK